MPRLTGTPAGGRWRALVAAVPLMIALVVCASCSNTRAVPVTTTVPTDAVLTPAGWVTHVYRSAALSVPADWTVVHDPVCPVEAAHGTLSLGLAPGPAAFCPEVSSGGHPTVAVDQWPLPGSPGAPTASTAGCPTVTVHGLRVQQGPCAGGGPDGRTTWTVPALGVQIVASDGGPPTGVGAAAEVARVMHTLRRATPVEIATRSPLVVRLTLAHTRVRAGAPIRGTVGFDNTTSTDVVVQTCAQNEWLDVGLVGHGITFYPVHTEIACAPSVHLAPGTTRFPVSVPTTYGGCSPPGTSTAAFPNCIPAGVPPLPPGTYRTTVITVGLPADTPHGNVLTVTLLR